MSWRTLARSFFGLTPSADEQMAAGMISFTDPIVVEDPTPPSPPQPRTWHIVSGDGYVMGVATEDPEDYTISIGWHPSFKERLAKARTRWVDYEAFHDYVTDTSRGALAHIYAIPTPIRVRSRDPREAEMDDRRRRGLPW